MATQYYQIRNRGEKVKIEVYLTVTFVAVLIIPVLLYALWVLNENNKISSVRQIELERLLKAEKAKNELIIADTERKITSVNELLSQVIKLLKYQVSLKTNEKNPDAITDQIFLTPHKQLNKHIEDLQSILSLIQESGEVIIPNIKSNIDSADHKQNIFNIEALKKKELEISVSIEEKLSQLNKANTLVDNELSELVKQIIILNRFADEASKKHCKALGVEYTGHAKEFCFDANDIKAKLTELRQFIIDILRERDDNFKYKLLNDVRQKELEKLLYSNKTSMPWIAGMMADYLTYDIEILAKKLEWGKSIERSKKVASIREIRAEAKKRIEEAKIATYQLEYLKELFPALEDVLETNYTELDFTGEIPEYDPVRKYLEHDEWIQLSNEEKNQLALDRYIESRKKSKWQIGRDYELSVAYEYIKKGFDVDTYGSYMGIEDMGRDIIAKKDGMILLIQCKYWSKDKTIHEKHIFQLFGSMVSYCVENNCNQENVKGVFITNIELSSAARKIAKYLGVFIVEHHAMSDFPRIKCNIGHSEEGVTKIYHLPMDEQYDSSKIDKAGEFYAFTVKEAEQAGFRRAYKHIER